MTTSAIRRIGAILAGCSLSLAVAHAAPPQKPADGFPSIALPGKKEGQRAVDELKKLNALNTLAQWYGMTEPELTYALTNLEAGGKLVVDPDGRIYAQEGVEYNMVVPPPATAGTVDTSTTFRLHSKPDARRTIALVFKNTELRDTRWNPGSGSISYKGFDIDDDSATFSREEQLRIQSIWKSVAEDFAPFDVDVTTDNVPADRISRSNIADAEYGIQVLVYTGGCERCSDAARAYLKSFSDIGDTRKPVLINATAYSYSAPLIAEAVSHMLGHSLGLRHDEAPRPNVPSTFGSVPMIPYGGHETPAGKWAPIMGDPLGAEITQFSNGDYAGANNQEDDFKVMQRNGLPLRADDVGGTRMLAAWLPVTTRNGEVTGSASGVIERPADGDVYAFHAGPGRLTATATTTGYPANADVNLNLINSLGQSLVAATTLSPPGSTTESSRDPARNATVSYEIRKAGTYYLAIKGYDGKTVAGYSSYGARGAYQLTASFQPSALTPPSAVFEANPQVTRANTPITLDASASHGDGGELKYNWNFGDSSNQTSNAVTATKSYARAGSYTVTLQVTDRAGLISTTQRVIQVTATGTAPPEPTPPGPGATNVPTPPPSADEPPQARLSVTKSSNVAPVSVTVNGGGSSDDRGIISYVWNVTNTPDTVAALLHNRASGTFSLPTAGTYTVSLTVTDASGQTSTSSPQTITVGPPTGTVTPAPAAPTAAFTDNSAAQQITVNFNASSSSNAQTYIWDWGDRTVTETTNPVVDHVFPGPGPYTVRLTVRNSAGATATTTRVVSNGKGEFREIVLSRPLLTLAAAPAGVRATVSTVAKDFNGNPVSGATISWTGNGRNFTSTTDNSGVATATQTFGQEADCVWLSTTAAEKPGYFHDASAVKPVFGCLTSDGAAPGLWLSEESITVIEGSVPVARVTLKALDMGGRPVAGAEVTGTWVGMSNPNPANLPAGEQLSRMSNVSGLTKADGTVSFTVAADSGKTYGCFRFISTSVNKANRFVGIAGGSIEGCTSAARNVSPKAAFTKTAAAADPLQQSFTGATTKWISALPEMTNARRATLYWDWADGTQSITPNDGNAVEHRFPFAGTYRVKMTAKNELGRIGTVENTITVSGPQVMLMNVQAKRIAKDTGNVVTVTISATDAWNNPLPGVRVLGSWIGLSVVQTPTKYDITQLGQIRVDEQTTDASGTAAFTLSSSLPCSGLALTSTKDGYTTLSRTVWGCVPTLPPLANGEAAPTMVVRNVTVSVDNARMYGEPNAGTARVLVTDGTGVPLPGVVIGGAWGTSPDSRAVAITNRSGIAYFETPRSAATCFELSIKTVSKKNYTLTPGGPTSGRACSTPPATRTN